MSHRPIIIVFALIAILSSCSEKEDDIPNDITEVDTTLVGQHGRLQVFGNQIVNKFGNPMSLAGNSFFWSNDGWGGERFYKNEVVTWLKEDWGTTIVRAAMGVEDPGGYLDNKDGN